jgi:hypothetical protein
LETEFCFSSTYGFFQHLAMTHFGDHASGFFWRLAMTHFGDHVLFWQFPGWFLVRQFPAIFVTIAFT